MGTNPFPHSVNISAGGAAPAGILLHSLKAHMKLKHSSEVKCTVYLLDHFLNEFVGSFQVLGVGAVQQARQHLTKHTEGK